MKLLKYIRMRKGKKVHVLETTIVKINKTDAFFSSIDLDFFLCKFCLYGLLIDNSGSTASRAIKVCTNSGRGLSQTWYSPGSQLKPTLAKLCTCELQVRWIDRILLHMKWSYNKSRVSPINIPHAAKSMEDDCIACFRSTESVSMRDMP
jgi:hypothetical protein